MDNYHFIGIGGIGMSALARILLQRGRKVSGSDASSSHVTEDLVKQGAEVFIGHDPSHLKEEPTVIYSTAVQTTNPEMLHAKQAGLSCMHRADLLATLMENYAALLVAGTHGKTTTSSLLAHVLVFLGMDPGYAIGGIVRSLESNGGHGDGAYFVAEADESDGSFLKYYPFGAIITNIDHDHLDFWKKEEALSLGFKTFSEHVVSLDHLFWCGDDPHLRALNLPGISYGFEGANDLVITSFHQEGWKNIFDMTFKGSTYSEIELPLIGAHNVLNAAAVFAMALNLNCKEEKIREAFRAFKGVGRRLEYKGSKREIAIYDDYGHHPTEVFATLRAVKQALFLEESRLVVVFQPHRYTRTQDCMHEFGKAFEPADLVILTDIYAAGEDPIPGVTTELFVATVKETSEPPVRYIPFNALSKELPLVLERGDVLVTMGAGTITHLGSQLLKCL